MPKSALFTGIIPPVSTIFTADGQPLPVGSVLRNPALDAAFKELVLTLPSEAYIAEQLDVVDPQRVHAVREAMRAQLADELAGQAQGSESDLELLRDAALKGLIWTLPQRTKS